MNGSWFPSDKAPCAPLTSATLRYGRHEAQVRARPLGSNRVFVVGGPSGLSVGDQVTVVVAGPAGLASAVGTVERCLCEPGLAPSKRGVVARLDRSLDFALARPRRSSERKGSPQASAPSKRSALVVEDDCTLALLCTHWLKRIGCVAETVANGKEALATLQDRPECFDIVVVDSLLPDIDGATLIKKIRAVSEVPVLATSGVLTSKDAQVAVRDAGAQGFLSKPLCSSKFCRTVEKLIDAAASEQPTGSWAPVPVPPPVTAVASPDEAKPTIRDLPPVRRPKSAPAAGAPSNVVPLRPSRHTASTRDGPRVSRESKAKDDPPLVQTLELLGRYLESDDAPEQFEQRYGLPAQSLSRWIAGLSREHQRRLDRARGSNAA